MNRIEYRVVEKKNHNAIHAICLNEERANYWINVKCPEYVKKGYFMDKTLKADSFEVIYRGAYEYDWLGA